jgi:uncharacterized membrane protein
MSGRTALLTAKFDIDKVCKSMKFGKDRPAAIIEDVVAIAGAALIVVLLL